MRICIADDIQNECLQLSSNNVEENTIVLKCCHPSFPPRTTPVMCYIVKISCVTACAVVDVNEEEIQTKEIVRRICKPTLVYFENQNNK